MTTEKLTQDTRVSIHSFGDDMIGFGTIMGISVDMFPHLIIYIVLLDDDNPWESQLNGFKCITVPNGCLTKV
jgi:hypothetical protein